MARLVPLVILFLLLPAVSALGEDLPQVLQPNSTAYSVSEVAILTQAITTLTETLNDYKLASRRYFMTNEWSSRDFAAYTAGILSEKGYEAKLVSAPGWPDGVHTWVIVGIPLDGDTAWVPVEASPEMGHAQQTLGKVPMVTDPSGMEYFDPRYVNFTDLVSLPPNLPPVAKIRPPVRAVIAGEQTRLLALGSYDPDGEIVLYLWNFGDGTKEVDTMWVARHTFDKAGSYKVILTVIDNRGKSTETNLTFRVLSEEEASSTSSGCGCHH